MPLRRNANLGNAKMADYGRLYEIYCDIARKVYHHEPISFERWLAIDARPPRRSPLSDIEFDCAKELEGDAQ